MNLIPNSGKTFPSWRAISLQRKSLASWLPLAISERKLLLVLLDSLALAGALWLGLWVGFGHMPRWSDFPSFLVWLVILLALWHALGRAWDAYDLKTAGHLGLSSRRVFAVGIFALVAYLLIPFLHPATLWEWPSAGIFISSALGFLLAGRTLYVVGVWQPVFERRCLIVGAGRSGTEMARILRDHDRSGYRVIGFVDDDTRKRNQVIEGSPVLGDRRDLLALVQQHHISTIILAITHRLETGLFQVLMDSLELGVQIIPMIELYEQLTGRVPIEHIGDNWYVAMPLDHPATRPLFGLAKRLLDIILASIGLLGLGLALPFIALAIYFDSPGPIFYTQERVGKGGKTFRIYKFRTMIPDAERAGQAVWAQDHDPRVTRVGRLLRATHVDEFPQFLNILKGEMSAVGPRPERPEFAAELEREIPFYRTRHAVRPGMAGWGLVKQGYGSSKEDALIKLQYDLYYIKHQSLYFDLAILLQTFIDVFTLGGR